MTEITTNTCGKCKVEKTVGDFGKDKSRKTGFDNLCKLCRRESSSKYRKKHPEKAAAASSAWNRENPEKVIANKRSWAKKNPGLLAAASARCKKKSKDELSDSFVKNVLRANSKITFAQIPQSLVELKRAQIQIANYLKEQAK